MFFSSFLILFIALIVAGSLVGLCSTSQEA